VYVCSQTCTYICVYVYVHGSVYICISLRADWLMLDFGLFFEAHRREALAHRHLLHEARRACTRVRSPGVDGRRRAGVRCAAVPQCHVCAAGRPAPGRRSPSERKGASVACRSEATPTIIDGVREAPLSGPNGKGNRGPSPSPRREGTAGGSCSRSSGVHSMGRGWRRMVRRGLRAHS
jgi:hypothetical protein